MHNSKLGTATWTWTYSHAMRMLDNEASTRCGFPHLIKLLSILANLSYVRAKQLHVLIQGPRTDKGRGRGNTKGKVGMYSWRQRTSANISLTR